METATSPGPIPPAQLKKTSPRQGLLELEDFDFDYEREEAEDEITRSILQTLSAHPKIKRESSTPARQLAASSSPQHISHYYSLQRPHVAICKTVSPENLRHQDVRRDAEIQAHNLDGAESFASSGGSRAIGYRTFADMKETSNMRELSVIIKAVPQRRPKVTHLQLGEDGESEVASAKSKDVILHRFKGLFPTKPGKKSLLSSSFHLPLKPSSHVKKLYPSGPFQSQMQLHPSQRAIDHQAREQRRAMAALVKNSENKIYVTIQELMQQVYVKYGVVCEIAQLKNGNPISSVLEIPSSAKQIHLIAPADSIQPPLPQSEAPPSVSKFRQGRKLHEKHKSSSRKKLKPATPLVQEEIPPRNNLSVLSSQPLKRTEELTAASGGATKPEISRPKHVSLHIQSLPPLTREVFEAQMLRQKNLEIQRITESLQPSDYESSTRETRGLEALSPTTRDQIKEAILKRFPGSQSSQGIVQNVSLRTMEAKFPDASKKGQTHQPQPLRTVKQQHKAMAAVMARMQQKSKGFQRQAYLTQRTGDDDEIASSNGKEALLDQILNKARKPSGKDAQQSASRLRLVRQSPPAMSQSFHERMPGHKFNRDLEDAGVHIQSIPPSQTIYQHYNSLDPIPDRMESLATGQREQKQEERPSSKTSKEEGKQQQMLPTGNLTAAQAAGMLNGSTSPHHQYAILQTLKGQPHLSLHHDNSGSAIINELRTFSFSPADLDAKAKFSHLVSPSPQQLSPLRPVNRQKKFLSPQRTLKTLHRSESKPDKRKNTETKIQEKQRREVTSKLAINSPQAIGEQQQQQQQQPQPLDSKKQLLRISGEKESILPELKMKTSYPSSPEAQPRLPQLNKAPGQRGIRQKGRKFMKGADVPLSISGNARELISTRNYFTQKMQLADQRQDLLSVLGLPQSSLNLDESSDLFKGGGGGRLLGTVNVPSMSENLKRGLVDGGAGEHHGRSLGAVSSIDHRNPRTLLLTTSLENDKLPIRNRTPLMPKKPRNNKLKPLPNAANASTEKLRAHLQKEAQKPADRSMDAASRFERGRLESRGKSLFARELLGSRQGPPGASLSSKKYYFLRLCKPAGSNTARLNEARATFFYLKNLQSKYGLGDGEMLRVAEAFDFILKVSAARGHWLKLKGAIFQTVDNAHYQIEGQAITVQQFKLHQPLFSQISQMVGQRILFALNINALSNQALVSLDRFVAFEALFIHKMAPLALYASFLTQFINNKAAKRIAIPDIRHLFKLLHKNSGVMRPVFLADLDEFLADLSMASFSANDNANAYVETEGDGQGSVESQILESFLSTERKHSEALFNFISGS